MSTVDAVIGANYGDEGKGMFTDYLSSSKDAYIVLCNGGPQRGHTVVLPNGKKHVFHHFGSGTFCGNASICSNQFIVNPMIYTSEHQEIKGELYVDKNCYVTTPFDMMLNQIIELNRTERHGSCGYGIYETQLRYERRDSLTYGELKRRNRQQNKKYLIDIRDNYFLKYIQANKLNVFDYNEIDLSTIIDHYLDDMEYMFDTAKDFTKNILKNKNLIFEMGQGLMLDCYYSNDYIHSTPSNTGIVNCNRFLLENDIQYNDFNIYYITRSYLTRHGEGYLNCDYKLASKCYDKTNVPNLFQGSIRYGQIDDEQFLADRCLNDSGRLSKYRANVNLVVTHLDEYNSGLYDIYKYFYIVYHCYGETRNTVNRYK